MVKARLVAVLSEEGMCPDAERSAALGEPRPGPGSLRTLLALKGLRKVAAWDCPASEAGVRLAAEASPARRLLVWPEDGSVRVEAPGGGLDPEPVGTIAEAFGANPGWFAPGRARGRFFVPIETRHEVTAAACVRLAVGLDEHASRLAVMNQVVETDLPGLVAMLVAAAAIGGARSCPAPRGAAPWKAVPPRTIFGFGGT